MSDLQTQSLQVLRAPLPAIAELAELDQWVNWDYITREGKQDKPPVNPHTGRFASHSDPATWSTYTHVRARGTRIGFVFHPSDPYSGVDLDGCRNQTTGAIAPWAQRWIDALHSYTEISPSGTGFKVFVRGTLPAALKHTMGAHKGIEVYSEQRYFTITGQHLAGTPTAIHNAQDTLDLMWAEYHKAPQRSSNTLDITLKKETPGERAAGRASLEDVKARFNAEHTLASLLEGYGAVPTGRDGFSCPFGCGHTHANTLHIYQDKLYSRSPNCKVLQNQGLDAFGLYVLIEHNDDATAAAKKLNPIAPAPKRDWNDDRSEAERWAAQHATESGPDYVLAPEELARRDADNQRRRTNRRLQADRERAGLRARAATDDGMISQARKMLEAHIQLATLENDHTWSIAAQAKQAGFSERHAQLGNEYLIAEGYLTRQLRGRKETAKWTLLTNPVERITTPQTSHDGVILFEPQTPEGSPMLVIHVESITDSLACERRATPQPDRDLLSHVRDLAREVAEPGWVLRDYTELDEAALREEASRLEGLLARRSKSEIISGLEQAAAQVSDPKPDTMSVLEQTTALVTDPKSEIISVLDQATALVTDPKTATVAVSAPAAAPTNDERRTTDVAELPAGTAGAWYDRAADWTEGGVLDLSQWHDPAQIRPRAVGDVDQVEQAEQLELEQPAPIPAAPARRRRRSEISATDRYRLDLAGMEETALAGELKKHKNTLKKHAGAPWLTQVREKLALVEAELDSRELAKPDTYQVLEPRTSRRRAVAGDKTEIISGLLDDTAQLQLPLELPTGNTSVAGFAPGVAPGSRPLTSSSRRRRYAPI